MHVDALYRRLESHFASDGGFPFNISHEFRDSWTPVLETLARTDNYVQRALKNLFVQSEPEYGWVVVSLIQLRPVKLVEIKEFVEFLEFYNLANSLRGLDVATQNNARYASYQMREKLARYFDITRNGDDFEVFEQLAKRNVYLSLIKSVQGGVPENRLKFKTSFQDLLKQILRNIDRKMKFQPSITNIKREIFTKEDFDILQSTKQIEWLAGLVTPIGESLFKKLTHACYSVNKLLVERNIAHVDEKITSKPYNLLTEIDVKTIVRAKRVLLEIQNEFGAYFQVSMLAPCRHLLKASKFRGEKIDIESFNYLIEEWRKKPFHPYVVIEGGGPVGLMAAITQFEAGANVSLFEKRSTKYQRTQIVRLDPKWMNMLKFYLGEQYYKLFKDRNHLGIIRRDGFGEIATLYLEEAIHLQLSKLISYVEKKINHTTLKRLAEHELVKVEKFRNSSRANQEEAYFVTALHKPHHINAVDTKVTAEVELLICAGGTHSNLRQKFFPSSSAVTQSSFYGVCSWLLKNIPYQDVKRFDFFDDFRGIIDINAEFYSSFHAEVLKEFYPDNLKNAGIDGKFRHGIYLAVLKAKDILKVAPNTHFQTRTFENLGLIYIGMELPVELKNFMHALRNALEQVPNLAVNHFVKQVQKCWFQAVLSVYPVSLTEMHIDSKFIGMFDVEQNRIHPQHMLSQINNAKNKFTELIVTAAGDAFSSPHFMRYSGLSGGRENVIDLQKFTSGMASLKHMRMEEKYALLNNLTSSYERIAQFVISRGSQFLKQMSEDEIRKNRLASIIKSLDDKIGEFQAFPNGNCFLFKENGDYKALHITSNTTFSITLHAGYLEIEGYIYDSIEQFILQL